MYVITALVAKHYIDRQTSGTFAIFDMSTLPVEISGFGEAGFLCTGGE
ncbi:hypothetical protein J5J10_00040 [Ciceribacter sp. L1K23]|nr:hypothetical protein [Ciceribacter sp. L1K23]MBR0554060.1 hypothetical protein [Ciceribacter sp. L1K23]